MNMNWILECFPEYEIIAEYDNIENKDNKENRKEIHGLKNQTDVRCMFCRKPFAKWKKKDIAHAISECVGNKTLINFCECYDCNHLFGEIAENHLGKFIMPYRIINEVYGKGKYRNVVKDMPLDKSFPYKTYRFEQKKNKPIFQSDTFEIYNMLIEQNGTGRLTFTEDGVVFTIPRQKYDPQLVYVSLLKMAYTLLPRNEVPFYIKGICTLYLAMSLKPYYDENMNEVSSALDESKRQEYMKGLPNLGVEICIHSPSVDSGVNVCLLKHSSEREPKLLFAIQMKWHTIVIPVLSDAYESGESVSLSCMQSEGVTSRLLDFSKIEPEFRCEMHTVKLEIPNEFLEELEEDLRKNGLLKEK